MDRTSYVSDIGAPIDDESWKKFVSHMEKAADHLRYGYIRKQDNPDLLMIDRWESETLCFHKDGSDTIHKRNWRDAGVSIMTAGAMMLFEQDCLRGREGYRMWICAPMETVQEALDILRDCGVWENGPRTFVAKEDVADEFRKAVELMKEAYARGFSDSEIPDRLHIEGLLREAAESARPASIHDFWKDDWYYSALSAARIATFMNPAIRLAFDDGKTVYFPDGRKAKEFLGIAPDSLSWLREGERDGVRWKADRLELKDLPKDTYNPELSAMKDLERNVSEIVAEAMNQENLGSLRDELVEAMADLSPDARSQCLDNAFVYAVSNSFPGCYPESRSYSPMGSDMRGVVLEELDNLDPCDPDRNAQLEETIADIRAASPEKFLSGFSVSTPDGMVIEVRKVGCGELLELNDAYPDLDGERMSQ